MKARRDLSDQSTTTACDALRGAFTLARVTSAQLAGAGPALGAALPIANAGVTTEP